MRYVLAATLALSGCAYSLDKADKLDASSNGRLCTDSMTITSCTDAMNLSPVTMTWFQTTILKPKCTFSSCHDGGASKAGKIDMTTQMASYMHLVNAQSDLDSTRKLVVPGNIKQSFLMEMLGAIKPDEADPPSTGIPKDSSGNTVGLMPMSSTVMCCQKLDAIGRWITDGAMNN